MKRSIERKLERAREDLNKIAEVRGMQDPLVLQKSQSLDELVNRFLQLQHQKNKKATPSSFSRTKGLPFP
ncbi:Spo0E family sporulation regulatory protein-aspartic acid phosphatase [Paenibacillus allorhizosphaerae]|uniref:Aspartyl-phosphate phosphatase Spo0E family protein n=1 Tax=Paenibacillus allorhizosphaerae TaxID=2849866 RepID=A0ABN7TQX1_9BACL|nr:aspartyl-phosphate phosphatase Spo0E family protein [Paenibacillus allorhizosphaerae]CAG7652078.1 hypothetical protein PAECIP111802_05130 [Paenibacillus allorhizosphaerae]